MYMSSKPDISAPPLLRPDINPQLITYLLYLALLIHIYANFIKLMHQSAGQHFPLFEDSPNINADLSEGTMVLDAILPGCYNGRNARCASPTSAASRPPGNTSARPSSTSTALSTVA